MATYVVDIETDGIVSSKIHVMSVGYKKEDGSWDVHSTNDYEKMKELITNKDNVLVGHNFKTFDVIELERVLDVKVEAEVIDTLALSWYIMPERVKSFGLAAFGEDYGVPKPKIDDWENLTYEEYKHRCEEDVKINILLWQDLSKKFLDLYEDVENCRRIMRYLMFKMDCVADQRRIGTLVDISQVRENIELLESLREPKERILQDAMPKGSIIKKRPKIMYKKSGDLSHHAVNWYKYLEENNLPEDLDAHREPANINSISQIKSWLHELGWKPKLFKDGANGKVPQVRDANRELCDSVLKLAEVEPAINELDGLSVINHRLGVLKSFIKGTDLTTNYTVAEMNGFTNTLRLKHSKPIANLPGVTGKIKKAMANGASKIEAIEANLRDGQIIRECIIAPRGYELCGSDITSLEDNTKRHYMWDYDPDYVEEQMAEGFDPHFDLALKAGAVTQEQIEQHNLYSDTDGEQGTSYKAVRDIYKMANYSCIYGVGVAKLAESVGITQREARSLREAYWQRNWSIKQLPKDIEVKTVNDQMWLRNPVNDYWYSIRAEKDIFSTLNQGTGAYVFDIWLMFMRKEGVVPFLQYHDEKLSLVKKQEGARERHKQIITESMEKVNDALGLNVEITVDVQFGKTYADVH